MGAPDVRHDLNGHQFIEVVGRRWCICCDLFQRRKYATHPWLPKRAGRCRKDTPYAERYFNLPHKGNE